MKPASILITDDQSNIRMMLRTALESEGYNVQEASNGREALNAIETQTPDLMVLDLNMPVLDGLAVLEQMKQLAAKVERPRVIVLTAYGSIPAAVKATRLGAIDFLEKPVTPTDLREAVASALSASPLPPPAANSPGGYEEAIQRIRKSLRLAEISDAQTLLAMLAERPKQHAAEYFNLLGVLYEVQHKWRLAKKFYGKAVGTCRNYEPAVTNVRRLYELQQFGRTAQPIALGDEPDILWFARLEELKH